MSWLSAAFTRAKGAVETAVSFVPIVGGAAARLIDGVHTGDEHQDAQGNWVNNSTGAPSVAPPSAAIQAQIDQVNAFNAAELARLRAAAAASAAQIGGGATVAVVNALDPNYLKRNALSIAAGIAVVILVGVLLVRKK